MGVCSIFPGCALHEFINCMTPVNSRGAPWIRKVKGMVCWTSCFSRRADPMVGSLDYAGQPTVAQLHCRNSVMNSDVRCLRASLRHFGVEEK
jgi:hypothetical protein